jgi:hypothetical protein
MGSKDWSNARNDESTIQDGGIKRGAALIPKSRKNIPKYEYSAIISKKSVIFLYQRTDFHHLNALMEFTNEKIMKCIRKMEKIHVFE